jgi:hypothetical protein
MASTSWSFTAAITRSFAFMMAPYFLLVLYSDFYT